MRWWLSLADEGDWGSAFTLRFKLQEFYDKLRGREVLRRYDRVRAGYLTLADYVDLSLIHICADMSMKARITRELSKATSDKAELNKTVLKWKKHFDEAGKVIGAGRKKKK